MAWRRTPTRYPPAAQILGPLPGTGGSCHDENNIGRSCSRCSFQLLVSVAAVVDAAPKPAKATRWSDRATWPNKKVPVAGDKVEIASGKEVILDVSPPALSGLTIYGKLSFSDKSDLELTTEWIMVHGELAIGTEASPYTHKATITLTDNVKE